MKSDRRKLTRLRRLERLREAERRMAAREAARCEGELARIFDLARRSQMLGQNGADVPTEMSGAVLQERALFSHQIGALTRQVAQEHASVETGANHARQELASARHRRERVTQRANSLARELALARNVAAHGTHYSQPKSRFGMEVE